jgi:hypothetical protein
MEQSLKRGELISVDIYDMGLKNAIGIILERHKTCSALYKIHTAGITIYAHEIEINAI